MEIKLYFQMLKKNWWFILLTAFVALAASLTVSYVSVPQYNAVARFIIIPSASLTDGRDVADSLDTLDRRSVVATYAEVMNSSRIFYSASELLGLDPLMLIEDYKIQAVDIPDSSVLELTVSGPDPVLTAKLGNAIGYQSIAFSRSLNLIYDLNVLDAAVPSEFPISPVPLRDGVVALVLGISIGAVLAVLSEQIRSPIEAYRQRLRLDNTTGLYNANYFNRILSDELTQRPDDTLTIGIIELAGLSDYLGTLPPAGLHSLLVKVTETLQRELRGNDVIARWNETSFIVMLPTTDGSAASRTFNRIYQALIQPFVLSVYDASVNLDPHVGGAVYSNMLSGQELLEKAQVSLEQSHRTSAKPVNVWELKNPFWA